MTYVERPGLASLDPDDAIWRYMDYPKLLHLLTSSTLPFVRADRLGDQWEGSVTDQTVQTRNDRYGNLGTIADAFGMFDAPGNRLDWFVTCWHESASESSQMWTGYGAGGVAVRSSWQRLLGSLPEDRYFIGGKLRYVDYRNELVDDRRSWSPLSFKRREYASEREVRIMTRDTPSGGIEHFDSASGQHMDVFAQPAVEPTSSPVVISAPVGLGQLVESIVVPPGSPKWQIASLVALLDLVGQPQVPVIRSQLEGAPNWGMP